MVSVAILSSTVVVQRHPYTTQKQTWQYPIKALYRHLAGGPQGADPCSNICCTVREVDSLHHQKKKWK